MNLNFFSFGSYFKISEVLLFGQHKSNYQNFLFQIKQNRKLSMGIPVKAKMPTEYNVLIMDEMEWQGAYALWHSISSILKNLHSVSISVLTEILIKTLYFCFT
jgi:hypothetical protein